MDFRIFGYWTGWKQEAFTRPGDQPGTGRRPTHRVLGPPRPSHGRFEQGTIRTQRRRLCVGIELADRVPQVRVRVVGTRRHYVLRGWPGKSSGGTRGPCTRLSAHVFQVCGGYRNRPRKVDASRSYGAFCAETCLAALARSYPVIRLPVSGSTSQSSPISARSSLAGRPDGVRSPEVLSFVPPESSRLGCAGRPAPGSGPG